MGAKSSRVSNLNPNTIHELRREVDLSPEEIKNWYTEYRNSLASNQSELTKDEFKKVYNSLFIGDASSFAEHIFRTFDKDGNGTVNFKEFVVGLCVSGTEGNTESKLKWAFKMYDIDGDGYVTWSEMREIMEAVCKMTNALLPKELNSPTKLTDRFFQQFDTNRDGKITYQEFCQGAAKDPVIIDLLQCNPDPEN